MLRDTMRRFIAERVRPHGDAWEEQGFVPREILREMGVARAARHALSRPSTAARGSIRSPTPCSPRSSAAPPTAASPSRCWCTPTWPRRTSITPARPSSSRAGCRTSPPAARSRAVAMTEADAGSDLASMRTTARTVAGGYVLNGAKMFITNGVHGDLYFVAAKTGEAGRNRQITMFAVEKGAPGFRVARALEKARLALQRHRRAGVRGLLRAGREPDRRGRSRLLRARQESAERAAS